MSTYNVGFIGAGGIAHAHAFALAALPYYYKQAPVITKKAVTASMPESYANFSKRYGFADAVPIDLFWQSQDIDTVFILGPNGVHYSHLKQALKMAAVRRIYIEKPLCVTPEQVVKISELNAARPQELAVQIGFQFLQMGVVRRALKLWHETDFGRPIHFQARYLHSGYLQPGYRRQRPARLKPAPEGGALADLGAHVLSLLTAFLGDDLEILSASHSGAFDDVPQGSDLCTVMMIRHRGSGAIGTVTASRISAGAGDALEFELRCEKGALRMSTARPDALEVFTTTRNEWTTLTCGNDYLPATQFPTSYLPSGWLRSLIHAHYLFLGGHDEFAFIPDLNHGLAVQRLVCSAAAQMTNSTK